VIGTVIVPPSTGRPSTVCGAIWNDFEIFTAASPKPQPLGSSDPTRQLIVPLALTVHSSTTRPSFSRSAAREG